MAIRDIGAGVSEIQFFQGRSGAPEEVGPEWVRGTRQLRDKLLVPRDPRGIVLACGFLAAAALGVNALVFGDPLGYAYLAGAAIGYFFLQTRLVPTALWLLISFGGAAGATAGNSSGWIVCGLGLLLAVVSLLPVPAEFRDGAPRRELPEAGSLELHAGEANGQSNGSIPDSSSFLEEQPESSRILEVRAATSDEPRPTGDNSFGDGLGLNEPVDNQIPSSAPAATVARVSISTMGRLCIQVNGRDLTERVNEQPRLEFLLSYLLARTVRGDTGIQRPALAEEVAPGISPVSQRDRLRKTLYALLSTLGPEAKGFLRVTSTHVTLDLSSLDVDVIVLEQLSRQIGRRNALIDAELADQIRVLLEQTAGEFLAGFSELEQQVTAGHGSASQVVGEAEVLIAGWRADLVQALAAYNEAAGHPQASIAYLKSALAESPQRQDLARLLVAAYVQTGQTARASEARLEYDLTQER